MYSSTDHVVRAIFRSYGLYGPTSEAEIAYGYDSTGIDASSLRENPYATLTFQGAPVRLYNDGQAFLPEDLPEFSSLDDVKNLVDLMVARAYDAPRSAPDQDFTLEFRIRVFLQHQQSLHGRLLAKDTAQTCDVSRDASLTSPFVLDTHLTRRRYLALDAVRIGPTFTWEGFTAPFSELTTELPAED